MYRMASQRVGWRAWLYSDGYHLTFSLWLDAGMANLGKNGVLFEDDTPDENAREGILDKPAAMTAAGASENSRMPEESRFEARGAEQGVNLVRPVAYAAQDGGGGGDAPADGGEAGSGASAGQGQYPRKKLIFTR